jgi:DNA-binding response OmpR family regulator
MKILIVEDEPNVVSFIRRGLMEANYEVSVALDGVTALQMIDAENPDIILLDVMIPRINGIDLCRKLRAMNINIPIIMITALGTTENIVAGLENGADDYIVKPFKFNELLARILAVTRRSKLLAKPDNVLRIADLEVDTTRKMVKRNRQPITLTATEYKLLEFLLKNKERVLSRAEILENVWDINFDMSTNVVDVYINYLRKKIDRDHTHKLIHTVVGMGYVLREEFAHEMAAAKQDPKE